MRRVKNKPAFTCYPYTELNWVYDYSRASLERKMYFYFINRLRSICEEHVSEWTEMFSILNKRIKEFKCQKKVEKMEADFE